MINRGLQVPVCYPEVLCLRGCVIDSPRGGWGESMVLHVLCLYIICLTFNLYSLVRNDL